MRLSALSDLVRTLAIASASDTYRQEDGELIGTRVFHQAVIRPRLRSDAQPVLPLGELRDLDNYLALGVTHDEGDLHGRGALLVLGEVDAYRWIIPLDKQCAAEDDSRSVWSDMEVLLVRGRIREALDHRAHGSYVGVHVDVF